MSIKLKVITTAASVAMLFAVGSNAMAQQQPAPQGERPSADGKGPGHHGRGGYGPRRGGMKRGMRGGMRGPGKQMGPGGIMQEFRGLDLTQAQREQIRGIMEANRPSDAVREEMRTINQARRDGTITEAQKTRAKELMEQGRTNMATVRQSAYGVLTAEQKAKLEARKSKMNERREKMKQRREECKQKPEGCQGPPPRPRG